MRRCAYAAVAAMKVAACGELVGVSGTDGTPPSSDAAVPPPGPGDSGRAMRRRTRATIAEAHSFVGNFVPWLALTGKSPLDAVGDGPWYTAAHVYCFEN